MAILFRDQSTPSPKTARNMRARLTSVMRRAGLSSDLQDRFLLAASELIVNLSYHPSPLPAHVRVELSKTASSWRLTVMDDGPPFDGINAIMGGAGLIAAESGMGLGLIASAFPDWRYIASVERAGWNQVVLDAPRNERELIRPTILIVDDDPVTRELVTAFLADDYKTVATETVEEALDLVRDQPPDLVVSDIRMPGKDGFAFRRRLAGEPGMLAVPFIFISGDTRPENLAEAESLAVDDVIVKPINKERLNGVIGRVLTRMADMRRRLEDRRDSRFAELLRPHLSKKPQGYRIGLATDGAESGSGDLVFDASFEDGHLLVFADLMGHGEQATIFAQVVAGFVYGTIAGASNAPDVADVLGRLNLAFLTAPILHETLATASVVLLRPNGRIDIAAAGHPDPFVIGADGMRKLSVGGPILGLADCVTFEAMAITLAVQDRLVLVSDGITESDRAGIDQHWWTSVAANATGTIQGVAETVLDAARERADHRLMDDATIIIVERDSVSES